MFRRPGDDLLDRWDGRRLIRTVPAIVGTSGPSASECGVGNTEGNYLPYRCLILEPGSQSRVEIMVNDGAREAVVQSLSPLFVTAPPRFRDLLDVDPRVASLNDLYPGLRPVLQHDLFTALVRSISAQQINLRWAAIIRARLAVGFGDRHDIGDDHVYSLNVERIALASPLDIRALQFTVRKAESIVRLAREFAEGRLSLDLLRRLPDEEIISRLTSLHGIGLWSAEWILCRTLGRPRVVAGDLGVRKAVGKLYLDGAMPSEKEVRQLTARWGPSAAIAQALVLHAYAMGA